MFGRGVHRADEQARAMTRDEALRIHTDVFHGALKAQDYTTLEDLYSQKPALFEVAEHSVPSRIAEALAHVGRAGRAGVVLIDFSNDRRGA